MDFKIKDGVTYVYRHTVSFIPYMLTSITIPDSVTSINNNVFFDYENLESIYVSENNKSYTSIDGVLFNKKKNRLIYFPRRKKCDNFVIPDSVDCIGYNAFYGCSSLTSITIPGSLISISNETFSTCEHLKSINVSENNKNYASIDGVLFSKDLKEIICFPSEKKCDNYNIPNGITYIGNRAFYWCSKLTSITIPNSVTSIGYDAFAGCKSLESITIPDNVTSIRDSAFCDCRSLTSITIPDSVTSIGNGAFSGCKSLTSITIPDSVNSIDDWAFYGCSNLKSIIIPNSVTSIDNGAFKYCSSLTSITIPDSVISIGNYAFSDCKNLTSIIIPNSVTSIGDNAFANCENLKSITIHNSVISISKRAFENCNNIELITIKLNDSSITVRGNIPTSDINFYHDLKNTLDFTRNENEKKDKMLIYLQNLPYKLAVSTYIAKKYDNETAKKYLKKNIKKIVRRFIDNNDAEKLTDILPFGYVTEENIDGMIQYAIDNKKPEMQVILMNYKNENFSFRDNFDDLML